MGVSARKRDYFHFTVGEGNGYGNREGSNAFTRAYAITALGKEPKEETPWKA